MRNVIVKKYFDLLPKVQQDLAMRRETSLTHKATKHVESTCTNVLILILKLHLMDRNKFLNSLLHWIYWKSFMPVEMNIFTVGTYKFSFGGTPP